MDCTYTCNTLYRNVNVIIEKVIFTSELYVLDMEGLEVILGMDWLGKYKATMECRNQRVVLRGPNGENVSYKRDPKSPKSNIVSTLTLEKSVQKGCELFVSNINEIGSKELKAEDILVVGEFTDLFPDKLPGMPPSRSIDLTIDLMLGTRPISKAPYHVAPKEMEELKA